MVPRTVSPEMSFYNGDINKWKKFANSLRLRYAMRISDANPQKAQEEFEKALAADGGIIASGADDALIPYLDIAFDFGGESYSVLSSQRFITAAVW